MEQELTTSQASRPKSRTERVKTPTNERKVKSPAPGKVKIRRKKGDEAAVEAASPAPDAQRQRPPKPKKEAPDQPHSESSTGRKKAGNEPRSSPTPNLTERPNTPRQARAPSPEERPIVVPLPPPRMPPEVAMSPPPRIPGAMSPPPVPPPVPARPNHHQVRPQTNFFPFSVSKTCYSCAE